MTLEEVIAELRTRANPAVVAGMYRVGINPRGTLGIQIPELQKLARRVGTDHGLALELWASGIHEARILAAMVDDPSQLGEEQMDRWVQAFNSWDVCDQVCKYLFARSSLAPAKAREWARHGGQFVKRAGFVLMADLAVNDKDAPDGLFLGFLELAEREAADDRNYVKKAVSWAVRQIGKRNAALNAAAVAAAQRIEAQGSQAARWIAADALRELTSAEVRERLGGAAQEGAGEPGEGLAVKPKGRGAKSRVKGTKRGAKQAAAPDAPPGAAPAEPVPAAKTQSAAETAPEAAAEVPVPAEAKRRGGRRGFARGKPRSPVAESEETANPESAVPETTGSQAGAETDRESPS